MDYYDYRQAATGSLVEWIIELRERVALGDETEHDRDVLRVLDENLAWLGHADVDEHYGAFGNITDALLPHYEHSRTMVERLAISSITLHFDMADWDVVRAKLAEYDQVRADQDKMDAVEAQIREEGR